MVEGRLLLRSRAPPAVTVLATRCAVVPCRYRSADLQEMSTAGYAVADVLSSVARYVVAMRLPPMVKGQLLDKLSDTE